MQEDARRKEENHQRLRVKQVAEPEVWTERMLDALVNGVQGGKWYSLMDKVYARKTIKRAWEKVKQNQGAAGVDQQSVERFESNAENYLEELTKELREGRYEPEPVKRVHIPKGKGKTRPLGIPTVKDRIVQAALLSVIEPIFDNEFMSTSYGFRPQLGCKDALREVDRLCKSHPWIVDIDLESYFDTIPHEALLKRIEERISDQEVLKLIERFLRAEIMDGMERWTPTRGTPQGAVMSPLLANIYLHPLDELLFVKGFKSVRYADDLVILCRNEEEAERAFQETEAWALENDLRLNREKSRIGNSRTGEGFDFLGYRFERGKRLIRKKSLENLKEKVRERTRRTAGESVEAIISKLNPTLRGWFEYFKHARKGYFERIDQWVRRRLRGILRTQKGWARGQGKTQRDHVQWPNDYFAKRGLFTMKEAHARALQSR